MPTKTVRFTWTRFPPAVYRAARTVVADITMEMPYPFEGPVPAPSVDNYSSAYRMSVTKGETTWTFDTFDEFLAELRHPYEHAQVHMSSSLVGAEVDIDDWAYGTTVSVKDGNRATVERLMGVFESVADTYRVDPPEDPPLPKPTVFIGHGHSTEWMSLKTYLSDQMGFPVEAYETGSRAGHTIRDVLDAMINATSFAILVMTGEDEQPDGRVRPRQNVVHETGLFQGALGFRRAIVLLEDDVEEFSNLAGIQYLPFRKGNIRDAFGDVIAALKREFPGTA